MYIELHTSSAFSFLDGASLPEALVERAAALGYPAIGLLDRDGVYGAPRFHIAAKRAGLKGIIGAEVTIDTGARGSAFGVRSPDVERRAPTADRRLFILPILIESRQGYRNLCRLITAMKMRSPKGEGALTIEDLDGHVGGLVALVGRAALNAPRFGVGGLIDRLVGVFGRTNVYLELQRHLLRDEEADNQALLDLASAFHVPVLASNGVRFAETTDRRLYDVLTCIRHKTTLERAGRRLSWNSERYLKPPDVMVRLFADIPQAVASTRELADRLEYTMADLGYQFPEYPVPAGETMASFLRKIAQAGARERYRPLHDAARRQIERELNLIEKLDLAGYFLIVWDIVNFCRQEDILVQGRGSAANSAVCYSLGITAVDPVGMDLLFERFLSEERGEWPDIDIDLPSGDRRERVIQHIYRKYGTPVGSTRASNASTDGPRVAMTANVITYRGRSAAREVGKALSLEPVQIDRLAKVMNHFEWVDPKETLDRNLREVGLDAQHPTMHLFGQLWQQIQDLPRHLGQHSGGMVICQGRLDDIVPLENASMPDRVVIQWDKDDCADMGLIKVDLLGLGMMAVLQDALALVNAGVRRSAIGARDESIHGSEDFRAPAFAEAPMGRPSVEQRASSSEAFRAPNAEPRAPDVVDLAHLPADDPAVYKMLQEADTVGIFQVESRAQMATLPRLKPQKFYDIVVEVAIIRPGPIVGQMVHPYLKRRQGVEVVSYPHPSLQPILERTLGVPLFQEQLLRMAMVAAGFSGGEAEELRRAFGFKRSEKRMQQIETKLRAGIARQGMSGDAAEEIIRSITSFALYGFPESHAASFALLVYASAYLKAHYPAAFCTAMLNNQPMGFYHPATLVKDAQRHGVRFAPIDVQESDWECRVEEDGRVRLGLMYVNGLRKETGKLIAEGRRSAVGARESETSSQRQPIAPAADRCPKCGCDDSSMLESTPAGGRFCNICAHEWELRSPSVVPFHDAGRTERRTPNAEPRYASLEDFVTRTGVRRDELATLAEIGALNAFGFDRRSALWQIEKVVRPAGELFTEASSARMADSETRQHSSVLAGPHPRSLSLGGAADAALPSGASPFGKLRTTLSNVEGSLGPQALPEPPSADRRAPSADRRAPSADRRAPSADRRAPSAERRAPNAERRAPNAERRESSPLRPMNPTERLMADYAGTSLTIGPHPMAMRRAELALRGVLRATDLPRGRHGRRVRIAGAVITRQRPGTAKGFVFLTLEDETGIANIIVQPDLFTAHRSVIVGEPYLLIEGTLQIQEGVTSVKAERVISLVSGGPDPQSHDFR